MDEIVIESGRFYVGVTAKGPLYINKAPEPTPELSHERSVGPSGDYVPPTYPGGVPIGPDH